MSHSARYLLGHLQTISRACAKRRRYDASMADVLFPISDEQILDLAHFLARFR